MFKSKMNFKSNSSKNGYICIDRNKSTTKENTNQASLKLIEINLKHNNVNDLKLTLHT